MKNSPSSFPRSVPPQPAIAWFLRDLVPDGLWSEFDIGALKNGQIQKTHRSLVQYGGTDAWLRFVEQTRTALPQMLAISLFDLIAPYIPQSTVLPRALTLRACPSLSVYAGGRTCEVEIKLCCLAHLTFPSAGKRPSGGYARAITTFRLKHAGDSLIERSNGEYFIPVP
ncbi:hypothetical protein P3T43_006719 [Paraburkholderia sp. GAS41]|jgi:hypothetical protein|uniref:hypothetical protein n=1 Tax=Paraburkholderia sp. GAS41 TaxID=3035134 RepID=UPI003D25CBFA